MQNAAVRVPVWLIVVYVLALATILAWPCIAYMSVFAFDAPGSAQNPAVWSTVILVLAYPLLPIIGVIASFITYRKGLRKPAYVLAGIGALPLVALLAFIVAAFVSSLAFLVAPKF